MVQEEFCEVCFSQTRKSDFDKALSSLICWRTFSGVVRFLSGDCAGAREAAEGNGVAWATVRRAKNWLGIKPYKSSTKDGRPWLWALPKAVEVAQKLKMLIL